MNKKLSEKMKILKDYISQFNSVVVAYSGGVDSTFLLKITTDVLGKNNVLGVTAKSETYTSSELDDAIKMAKELGFNHKIIETSELEIDDFANNPPNRCYYCKKELMMKLKAIAKKFKDAVIFDGTNFDDKSDHRPGMIATKELNIKSPLLECGFTKDDIRALSKEMKLPTYDKPSFACLASRFPYGTRITKEKLKIIDKAEKFLRKLGIKQVRVRYHNEIVRIEVAENDMKIIMKNKKDIVTKLKSLGFNYITLDLQGYRTGSMNEVLK